MTTFVDFVVASGTGKITQIREAKAFYEDTGVPYHLRAFYKPLTEAITASFAAGGDRDPLDDCTRNTTDAKKIVHYKANVAGLKKWLGRKTIAWNGISSKTWKSSGLDVSVNPEIGATVAGQDLVFKFYLKAPELSKRSIEPMLRLLEATHGRRATVGEATSPAACSTPTADRKFARGGSIGP